MIKEIIKKRKRRRNTLQNQIDSLKDELLNAYRKIDEKDQKIIELFYVRDDLKHRIKELAEENGELREKEARKKR